MASITADREDQPSLMPGKGKSEEAGQVGCVAVVLLALLLPSPSLLACPLPPVTRCSLHKATILEQAGIKWKWKISRFLESNRITRNPLNGGSELKRADGVKRVFTMHVPQHRIKHSTLIVLHDFSLWHF